MCTTFRKLTAAERQLLTVALALDKPVSTAGFKIDDDTTKPSCDWSHVATRFNYLSRDSDGEAFFYTKAPSKTDNRWIPASVSEMYNASIFTSFNPGNCDWRESLVARPGIEE